MTERPIKFWKFTLVLIMIMIGLTLSKTSFGAEAICFVNNLKNLEVSALAKTLSNGFIKEKYIVPGEKACYVVEDGTRYIVELEASDFSDGKRDGKRWSLIAFYGVGVYDILIENDFLRAVARPQD